jgi:hypothetical protein
MLSLELFIFCPLLSVIQTLFVFGVQEIIEV